MRIESVELSGFRAFPRTYQFDLNADAVIIYGPNGQGKTSLFDGILWALTGKISRLNGSEGQFLSMYSETGEFRVVLDLITDENEAFRIVRSYDGEEQHLRLEYKDSIVRQGKAGLQLLEMLWPQALVSADGETALEAAITRSVYLQQDLVRQFIEADTEQDRFNAVSEMVGAGRVTELHVLLERAKKAWSQATNIKLEEAQSIHDRLTRLESQLLGIRELDEDYYSRIEEAWASWWDAVGDVGVTVQSPSSPLAVEASSALDSAVKQLQVLKRANDRRRSAAGQLLAEIEEYSEVPYPDQSALRAETEDLQTKIRETHGALSEAEERVVLERRRLREVRKAREELKTLAQLALRHLGDRCPVCTQQYDEEITRRHLEELAQVDQTDDEPIKAAEEAGELALTLDELEQKRSGLESRLQEIETLIRVKESHRAELAARLVDLEIDTDPELARAKDPLELLLTKLSNQSTKLTKHENDGEKLALDLAQVAEQARLAELREEVEGLKKEKAEIENIIRRREDTGELAGKILDGLREAASEVVQAQLLEIEPVLQKIYARIDPHPTFRIVNLLTSYRYGRGHIATAIGDPVTNLSTSTPSLVLSSSQMNALAVSIFLAFNLGIPNLPLSTAILDDPFQSLDDVNLLGLIDLLRRTRDRRQLLISTHDARFARLLERKLRPIGDVGRTVSIHLEGWSRDGPEIIHRDIPIDAKPLRFAA